MAKTTLRRAENVPGDFFVDTTCIDCDTCRWIDPRTFGRAGEQSFVQAQPDGADAEQRALMALVACPTASIGTVAKHDVKPAIAAFPERIADGVYHCGFHDERTFGAASYLVVRPGGNVLVDAPRFSAPLVERIAALGGVATLFLTHRDDVGAQARFRERFHCERVVHARDADAIPGAERVIEGDADVALADDLVVIPTPGHTEGSACLLHRGRAESFLFSGDHLAFSARLQHVYAFRTACWFDWDVQIESVRRLAGHEFEWILPGHGRRCRFDRATMRREIEGCVEWMRGNAPDPDE